MNRGKIQLPLNFVSTFLAFVINSVIQFVITPILTKQLGDESYGFITIANDFTMYANVFAVVLNSVAARFISVEVHRKNIKKAEQYYSSVFFGNLIICGFLILISTIFVKNFDNFLNVSSELVNDVRLVFILTFVNYILSVYISIFSVATFVKNRLDLVASRNILSYFVKLLVIIYLFVCFVDIKVYYIVIATLVGTVVLGLSSMWISKKIMPEVKLNLKLFEFSYIYELLKSGVWMIINNLSNVFTNNVITIMVNVMIGSDSAGFLAVAKTVPNCANSLLYSIYSVFSPTFVKLYAEEKYDKLREFSVFSMKIMALIIVIPLITICVLGYEFMTLWQSYRNESEIHSLWILMCLAMALVIINVPLLSISQLGLTVNKIKIQMINNLIVSIITMISMYISIRSENTNLYIILFVILIIQGCKWIFFTPLYAASIIKIRISTFFVENIKICLKELIIIAIFCTLKFNKYIYDWKSFVVICFLYAFIGYFLFFFMIFNKEELRLILGWIKNIKNKV